MRPCRIVYGPMIAMVLAIGCSAGEPGMSRVSAEDSGESLSMRSEESVPTPRMIALAHILGGSWVENEWFSKADVDRTRDVRISPGGVPMPHDPYIDKIEDPESCTVARSFLTHAGGVQRTIMVEIECEIFWREVAYVDRFFESRGFLPASSLDLAAFLESPRFEWRNER